MILLFFCFFCKLSVGKTTNNFKCFLVDPVNIDKLHEM